MRSHVADARPQLELGGTALALGAGERHACAVLSTRDLVCWGDVSNGKLGYGPITGNPEARNVGDDETPASMGVVPLF